MNPVILLSAIGKNFVELIKMWFNNQKIKKQKQLEILEARVNAQAVLQEKTLNHEIDWDMIQAKQSRYSWKDEFWTIILSIPLIMCFIPGLEKYAVKGFENLEAVPEWYIISVGVAMASAFGFRKMVSFMKK